MRALLVLVLMTSLAHADDDAKQKAVALFDEGIKEMKAGNYDKACASLKQSLDLVVDSGTKGSLARCYEKQGKVASAWKLWKDLAETAPTRLRADAATQATKLEPRLPTYIYHLGPGAPRVNATIDGVPVEAPLEVPVPIDPGKYVFEASAEGFTSWKHEFTAVEGKQEEITIPALARVQTQQVVTPPPVVEEHPKSSRKKIGFALMGVGGAFVIGGSVLGVIAKGRYDDAKDICGGDIDRCDPARTAEAQDKVDSARTAGNLSTIGFVVGGAAVVAGVVLYVTAPKASTRVSIAPAVNGDSAGVVVSGGF